jgi:ferric-chelate reductase
MRRDLGVPLDHFNGSNIWLSPGTAINSTEAFHHATTLEKEAYEANRWFFVALMIIMLGCILYQLPYTYIRIRSTSFTHGFRLREAASSHHKTPKRLQHLHLPLPIYRVPYLDLPLSEFLLVLVLWAGGLGVAAWCQAAFLTDASRSTLVIMCLAALTAGLGVKSGGIGTWVVYGYTAVNFLHRWTGRLVLLLSTLHVLAYLIVFYKAGSEYM